MLRNRTRELSVEELALVSGGPQEDTTDLRSLHTLPPVNDGLRR